MYKSFLIFIAVLIAAFCAATQVAWAGPDQYVGDTSIYGGTPTVVEPNVLLIIDDSGSMGDFIPGGVYDPNTTYAVTNHCIDSSGHSNQPCSTNAVYTSSYNFFNANVNNITTSCRGLNPQDLLETTGQYNGRRLNTNGTCRTNGSGNYLLGNYINWKYGPGALKQKLQIAKDVIDKLVTSTGGMKFGLMTFHYPGGNPQGSQFVSITLGGSTFVTTVSDMTTTLTGAYTNRDALVRAVDSLTTQGATPLGESLFEAMRYFQGGQTAFGNTVGVDATGKYASPIEYGCQKNYIIFVTDGMSNSDDTAVLRSICNQGDCDNDGVEPGNLNHSLDDIARYMYYNDLRPDAAPGGLAGMQNVTTYTIGFGLSGADADAVTLLQRTADQNHGHGNYYLAGSETDLSSAFTSIISEIFSVNTSFVAPVVPVSPENRTYSGSRVYMGFFKPEGGKFWSGNLKKFGLDDNNNIVDVGGRFATYEDSNNDRRDDRDNAILPVGSSSGGFRDASQSYWSVINDGGLVDVGGVGDMLLNRTVVRNIYTYTGTNRALSDPTNAFTSLNINISETQLGFMAGDLGSKDDLINFIYGLDSYDENGNTVTDEKRSWILGDILHSRPQIVSYNTYTVGTDEPNCSRNKTMIFVGANDGMLHAFKDCDGSEGWAFIPPDLLPVLKYMATAGNAHTYYVDFSPSVYIYNKMKDGTINPANGDKVFLLFGLRRGGGIDSSPTKGYYYALDVTDPLNPQFMWTISNATTGFSELGESWSDLTIGKIKVGSYKKVAAFIGGGYDNCNEDARYGLTMTYPGTCVSSPTGDNGITTSAGAVGPVGPKGRGIFVVDIATFDSNDIPQVTLGSGTLIKSFTNADYPTSMKFSFPGRIKPIDRNYDGFADTLYAGDAGGNLWRMDISSTATTGWSANKIFSSNPGYSAPLGSTTGAADSSTGRKIFYDPSGFVLEDGTVRLYFGSGDREHPLNTAVVDRMYALIDRGQTTASGINESNMADVTEDELQGLTTTTARISQIISQLTSPTNYGWYIRLNQNDGEKVLAPAVVFNQMAVFTTFSPDATPGTDPCVTGNLGAARIYVLDYLTGAAVINYDLTNDTTNTYNVWARASGANYNLLRSDRVKTLGGGIPSGAVLVIAPTGQTTLMVGVGGSIAGIKTTGGGVTLPIYWRQKGEHLQ
jgi:type IV pilus assembly protein PilY1